MKKNHSLTDVDEIGDNHLITSIETPLRADAFEKGEEEKMKNIEQYFFKIMEELGLDMTDKSLKGTPHRVAKMYIKELFSGLSPSQKPKISTFPNHYAYQKLLIEKNITLNSICEHHFLPIVGQAHVAYQPNEKVIGISKINRLVNYYARRPQVQERLTIQILNDLQTTLETQNVIVMIEAQHLCVSSRGIKDVSSKSITMEYGGVFEEQKYRHEFLNLIQ